MRILRTIVGAAVWLGIAVTTWWWAEARLQEAEGASPSAPKVRLWESRFARQLWRYASSTRRDVDLKMDRLTLLAVGDPIFIWNEDGSAVQVGEVTRLTDASGQSLHRHAQAVAGQALLYPYAPPLGPEAHLEYYATPDSLEWVLETMLPPEKRRQIAAEVSAAFEAHHEEIVRELRPVLEQGLREALAVVEQDLPTVIQRHRPELERLGEKYRGEVVEKRLAPLVRREIWPIVQRRAQPLAQEIGQEVWQRASVWRFGWRYAYDITPLPEKNLVEKEWSRFLREDIMPVLESHTDDFIHLQQQIISDVARNERVRRVVRQSVIEVADDPEVQRLAWRIFREALVDNPRLRETLERRWRSEETQRALTIAAARLEPTVRRIGDMLFGTREEGITPEFARVLRSQILGKDRRWLVLVTSTEDGVRTPTAHAPMLRVRKGGSLSDNPFIAPVALDRRLPLVRTAETPTPQATGDYTGGSW